MNVFGKQLCNKQDDVQAAARGDPSQSTLHQLIHPIGFNFVIMTAQLAAQYCLVNEMKHFISHCIVTLPSLCLYNINIPHTCSVHKYIVFLYLFIFLLTIMPTSNLLGSYLDSINFFFVVALFLLLL